MTHDFPQLHTLLGYAEATATPESVNWHHIGTRSGGKTQKCICPGCFDRARLRLASFTISAELLSPAMMSVDVRTEFNNTSHHGLTDSSRLSCVNCQVNLVVRPKIVAENPNHPGIHFLIPNPEFRLANLVPFHFE